MANAKPFLKWVGGKGQLIEQLERLLPKDFDRWKDVTYIEPFVGGGAMLFHMLSTHENITRVIINDCNKDLITCYKVVRDQADELIDELRTIGDQYSSLTSLEDKKELFLRSRDRYNTKSLSDIEKSALLIFLNKTCFNGLYRVNRKGLFNVPFGKNEAPAICAAETIIADSQILQNVEITHGDFETTLAYTSEKAFFYLDPPYRPLSATSSFNDYTKEPFDDTEQIRLKGFCDRISASGGFSMLSNSDCYGRDGKDRFFEDLYADYNIERVWAARYVNANPTKRGKLTELVIRNYQ